MSNRKAILHCEHCCYAGCTGEDGAFDVTVPLTDAVSGKRYVARLGCEVHPEAHRISLKELVGEQGESPELGEESRERLETLLDQVGRKRICGNATVCPSQVVDIVKRSTQRPSAPGT